MKIEFRVNAENAENLFGSLVKDAQTEGFGWDSDFWSQTSVIIQPTKKPSLQVDPCPADGKIKPLSEIYSGEIHSIEWRTAWSNYSYLFERCGRVTYDGPCRGFLQQNLQPTALPSSREIQIDSVESSLFEYRRRDGEAQLSWRQLKAIHNTLMENLNKRLEDAGLNSSIWRLQNAPCRTRQGEFPNDDNTVRWGETKTYKGWIPVEFLELIY